MTRSAWIFLLLFATGIAHGDPGEALALFQQGRLPLSLVAGYGTFNDNGYFVAGVGAGYYVLEGLELGLDGEAWVGSQPQIYNVSPHVRYIFLHLPGWVTPYVGGFYRRTFYNRELNNINSAGGRAGFIFPFSARTYINTGLVYEHYYKCETAVYSSCDSVYPEVGLSFSY